MYQVLPQEYNKRINLFSKVNRTAVSFHNANPALTTMTPIDLNDDEVLCFLQALQNEDVKYLLVGGFAMAFHGYIRATSDLDIWIKDDPENLERLKVALKKQGVAGIDQVRSFMIDPMKNLKAFSSFDFDACYSRAQDGEYRQVKFKVLDPNDLLKKKQATNRLKDQADIEFLKGLNL